MVKFCKVCSNRFVRRIWEGSPPKQISISSLDTKPTSVSPTALKSIENNSVFSSWNNSSPPIISSTLNSLSPTSLPFKIIHKPVNLDWLLSITVWLSLQTKISILSNNLLTYALVILCKLLCFSKAIIIEFW